MHSNTVELMGTATAEAHHIRTIRTVFKTKMVSSSPSTPDLKSHNFHNFRSAVEQPSWSFTRWRRSWSFTLAWCRELANYARRFSTHPCWHFGFCRRHNFRRSYAFLRMDDRRSNLLYVYCNLDCNECFIAYKRISYGFDAANTC